MTIRELRDMIDIILVERQLGNKDDEDPSLVFYKNGKAISINNIYIPETKVYGETVVALSQRFISDGPHQTPNVSELIVSSPHVLGNMVCFNTVYMVE